MTYTILPPEHVGNAIVGVDGTLDIGGIPVSLGDWGAHGPIPIYVRRSSEDLSVVEVILARHDGVAQIMLQEQNQEARNYALGPKEYWRGEIVGKWTMGSERRPMTDADFEDYWEEGGFVDGDTD